MHTWVIGDWTNFPGPIFGGGGNFDSQFSELGQQPISNLGPREINDSAPNAPFICQIFRFVSNPERLKFDWVKNGQILHFSPPVKVRGGWAKCLSHSFQFSL